MLPMPNYKVTCGFPIAGDFDGDGLDDLATWNPGNEGTQTKGEFQFDLANNGLTGNIERRIELTCQASLRSPLRRI